MRALTISANGFEDSELIDPVTALTAAGVEVDIASLTPGTITGKRGTQVQATLDVADARAGDYDLLLLPGGKAPAELRRSEHVLELTRALMDAGKPVAAICHGPQVLISAERVRGRQMTSYESVATELEDAGADYRDDSVVVDGNLITSRHPGDIPLFVEQILHTVEAVRTPA